MKQVRVVNQRRYFILKLLHNKLRLLEEQKEQWEYVMPYVEKTFGGNSDDYKQCYSTLLEIRNEISKVKERMERKGANRK